MDYKKMIMEMLQTIENQELLIKIYTFINLILLVIKQS